MGLQGCTAPSNFEYCINNVLQLGVQNQISIIAAFYFLFHLFFFHFQNAVYGLTGLLSVLIPDIPAGVRTQIQRENLLAREVLFDAELDGDKSKKKANNNYDRGK